MVLIYHGCFTKNADGTNKLIGPGEKFLTPAAQCFWKDRKDVRCGVKTRSQSANQPTVSTEDYKYYFFKKATNRPMDFRNRKVYYESNRSVLYCLIFTVILSYIVHNISKERKHN